MKNRCCDSAKDHRKIIRFLVIEAVLLLVILSASVIKIFVL